MKAAQISKFGGQDVMTVVDDAALPAITEDQVLVKVHAASLNPFDYKIRDGDVPVDLAFPAILGGDLAGVITEIGSAVTNLSVGDEVYGQANALSGHGSYAEFAPAKASSLSAKPASLDFTTAAALPLAAVSAYQALIDHAQIKPGYKVLVHGGAGGIGSLAIQIAKKHGAYVATTALSDNLDYVKSLGADQVIDYKTQDFADELNDYDVVFDTVGGDTNKQSYRVLKTGGALVSLVEDVDKELATSRSIAYTHMFTGTNSERLAKITEMIKDGSLQVNIDKVFPLDQAPEALEYLKTQHPRGKVVLQISN